MRIMAYMGLGIAQQHRSSVTELNLYLMISIIWPLAIVVFVCWPNIKALAKVNRNAAK